MKTATVCGKWKLPIFFDSTNEDSVSRSERSYIHYAVKHPELVSAKCWATEWLFSGTLPLGNYSAVEYLAGVGVQSIILKNTISLTKHLVLERDENCVKHLINAGFDTRVADARKLMSSETEFDIKLADFPSSSIVSVDTKWRGFKDLFTDNTKLIVWTDTAISYPLGVHGKRYGAKFGIDQVRTKEEYIELYSKWISKEFGFAIKKAAIRGKNAIYFAAVPHSSSLTVKEFPVTDTKGFSVDD
jgi:hypothetical protein